MMFYFLDHLGEIASLLTIIGSLSAVIIKSNSGIKEELKKIREDADRANNRIDNMYTVMLGFLNSKIKNEKE